MFGESVSRAYYHSTVYLDQNKVSLCSELVWETFFKGSEVYQHFSPTSTLEDVGYLIS